MSIQIGNIISRNAYRSSAIFSDYGNVVFDNNATLSSTSDAIMASSLEFLKMIKESLQSLNIESYITTYSNAINSSDNICICLNFINNSIEYQLSFNYWRVNSSGSRQFHLYFCTRDNATDIRIRPIVPSSVETWYDVWHSTNCEFSGILGDLINQTFWTSSSVTKVQVAIYDSVFYLLSTQQDFPDSIRYIIGGKIGIANNLQPFSAISNDTINMVDIRNNGCVASLTNTGIWGEIISPIIYLCSMNTSSEIVAFPVYFTGTQSRQSAATESGQILVADTRYIIATSGYPNIPTGKKFVSGKWLCPQKITTSGFLIPWDGTSASVFD